MSSIPRYSNRPPSTPMQHFLLLSFEVIYALCCLWQGVISASCCSIRKILPWLKSIALEDRGFRHRSRLKGCWSMSVTRTLQNFRQKAGNSLKRPKHVWISIFDITKTRLLRHFSAVSRWVTGVRCSTPSSAVPPYGWTGSNRCHYDGKHIIHVKSECLNEAERLDSPPLIHRNLHIYHQHYSTWNKLCKSLATKWCTRQKRMILLYLCRLP